MASVEYLSAAVRQLTSPRLVRTCRRSSIVYDFPVKRDKMASGGCGARRESLLVPFIMDGLGVLIICLTDRAKNHWYYKITEGDPFKIALMLCNILYFPTHS
jgi:hypothetical protein